MSDYSIYALAESEMTISGGAVLDGVTQGDGSHLLNETITLNSNAWEEVLISDGGSDANFSDTDSDQRLDGAQTIFGTSYADNLRVEAEYTLTVEDPDGNTYTLIGFNINEGGGGPAYGTVEGLAFIGSFPPRDVALTVIGTAEGPPNSGGSSTPASGYATPPCFAVGTLIDTPSGPRPVENLRAGDLVDTLDSGPQPVLWARREVQDLDGLPFDQKPVLIQAGALGPSCPARDLLISPQHRVLVGEVGQLDAAFRAPAFVPAKALTRLPRIRHAQGKRSVTWCHFALERHGIVRTVGCLTESLLLGPMVLASMVGLERRLVDTLFPGPALGGALNGPPARRCLSVREARRCLRAEPALAA